MKLDEVKPRIKKILSWLKTYWYIPVLAAVAVALMLAGRNTKWLFDLLEKKNDLHRREVESIDKALEKEREDRAEALERYEKTVEKVEKEYEEKIGELDDKKKKEIAKTVKKHQADPEKMVEEIAERFGFTVVKAEEV